MIFSIAGFEMKEEEEEEDLICVFLVIPGESV